MHENYTILNQAYSYYNNKYGTEVAKVKKEISETVDYWKANPDEVANSIIYLDLAHCTVELWWTARVYCCIEIPLDWKCNFKNKI